MTEQELKPCPFCGSDGKYGMVSGKHYAACINQNCNVVVNTPYKDSMTEAIAAWNQRADGWISVDDEKPAYEQRVIVRRKRKHPEISTQIIHWTNGDEDTYSHWMPEPAPPGGCDE
jgi:Lar family restriction alleviation protein